MGGFFGGVVAGALILYAVLHYKAAAALAPAASSEATPLFATKTAL